MSDEKGKEKKSLFSNFKFLKKVKEIKNIEIILIVIFICVIFLIYFSSSSFSKSETNSKSGYTNVIEYTKDLENKLEMVLKNVQGAGNVSVMITVDSGIEYVYASSTEEKSNSNTSGNYVTSSTTTTKTPINGVIVKEIPPKILGVVVVSSGANDINTKLSILKIIQTVLDVENSKIEIIVGE